MDKHTGAENKARSMIYNPLNAALFAKIFENETAALAMQGLLNGVLQNSGDKVLADIQSLHSELPQNGVTVGDKVIRLDVLAETKDHDVVNVEVQLRNTMGYTMHDRSLFYASRLMNQKLKTGDEYTAMPRVIMVNLLNYSIRENHENFHHTIGLLYRNPPHEIASDRLCIHNIELPKFKLLEPDMNNMLHVWLYTLTEGIYHPERLKEVIGMDAGLNQFMERYNLATMDEHTLRLYRQYEDAERDAAAERRYYEVHFPEEMKAKSRAEGRAEGKAEGKAEGLAEGEAKGKAEGLAEGTFRMLYEMRLTEDLPQSIYNRKLKALKASPEQIRAWTDAFHQEHPELVKKEQSKGPEMML